MKRKILLSYFVFFLTFTPHLKVQADPIKTVINAPVSLTEIQKKAIVGRDMGFHRQYDETIAYFKELEKEVPQSPLSSFAIMTVWQSRMLENYDFRFEKEYEEVSERNEKIVDQILSDENSSAWDLFLAGSSAGLRSFYYMRKDSLFKALSQANIVHKAFQKAHLKDPNLVDVDLGFGMYEYWRSVFTNRYKFLPFFKDQRAEGLAKIERATREGKLVGPMAEIALSICYNNEGRRNESIALLQGILRKYPESIVAKNSLAEMYTIQGRYAEAHQLIDTVLQQDSQITVAKFFKGKIYSRENKIAEARKFYEEYLASNPTPAWKSYALTDLGFLDLRENDQKSAYDRFKTAYRAYSDNSLPLKELNKLREKRWE